MVKFTKPPLITNNNIMLEYVSPYKEITNVIAPLVQGNSFDRSIINIIEW